MYLLLILPIMYTHTHTLCHSSPISSLHGFVHVFTKSHSSFISSRGDSQSITLTTKMHSPSSLCLLPVTYSNHPTTKASDLFPQPASSVLSVRGVIECQQVIVFVECLCREGWLITLCITRFAPKKCCTVELLFTDKLNSHKKVTGREKKHYNCKEWMKWICAFTVSYRHIHFLMCNHWSHS